MNISAFRDALGRALPNVPLNPGETQDVIATIEAAHPAVGAVWISAEDSEVIVSIGEITHGHFACYDTALSESEAEARIASEVAVFLSALFAGRVQLWSGIAGSGGWRVLASGKKPRASRFPGVRSFLWSGPIS